MKRTLVRLVPMLLLVGLAGPARAQSAEAKKYLNAAITLYENLEYEKALKQLQKARTRAAGPDDEARISLLEGCVLADMGKEEKALTAFKTAFGIDVEAKLPVEVSPKVQVVVDKARANVRKMLAPQFEAQKAEEEKRLAEEEKRLAEEKEKARKAEEEKALAEQRRRDEEEARRLQPPPAVVAKPAGASLRTYSWIPGVVGLASAGAATFFLVGANSRYQALVSGTPTPEEALAHRDTGKTYATLGYVFSGVAVAGVATAVVMFALGGGDAPPPVALGLSPGGAFVLVRLDAAWRALE